MILRNSWRVAFVLASLAIALVTLTPADVPDEVLARTPWWCLICGDQGFVDVLLNVALFIPFGLTLRGIGIPIRRSIAIGLAATILIECAQGWVIPGRDPSASDVLTNTGGTAIGAWLTPHGRRVLFPPPRLAAAITTLAAVMFVAQAIGSAVLFAPAPIESSAYEVQWGQVFPGTVAFQGEIVSAEAEGIALPAGRLDSTSALIVRLASNPSSVSVEVLGAPRVRARAQIVAVHDGNTNVITWFNQNVCDIEFRLRLSPARFRLNYPAVATRIPCDLDSDRLRLDGRMTRKALSVEVTDLVSGRAWRTSLAAGPNLSWSYLVPWYRGYHTTSWPSAAWVLAWMVGLSYYAYFNLQRSWRLIPAVVALGALGVLPVVLRLTPVSPIEWAGAALGIAMGWLAARTSQRVAGTR